MQSAASSYIRASIGGLFFCLYPRLLILSLLGPSCGGRNMALQPHVNGEVAIMLIIVGNVVNQHSAPDGIARSRARNVRNLHRLNEVSVVGRCVYPVAIDEGVVQRLNECGLGSDLLVVSGCWRLFARSLRTEEEVRFDEVTDNLTEGPELRRWSKGVFIRRHVLCRLCQISANHRVHRISTARQRWRQLIGIANVCRLSEGRR